jgi:hypothetical protein
MRFWTDKDRKDLLPRAERLPFDELLALTRDLGVTSRLALASRKKHCFSCSTKPILMSYALASAANSIRFEADLSFAVGSSTSSSA